MRRRVRIKAPELIIALEDIFERSRATRSQHGSKPSGVDPTISVEVSMAAERLKMLWILWLNSPKPKELNQALIDPHPPRHLGCADELLLRQY